MPHPAFSLDDRLTIARRAVEAGAVAILSLGEAGRHGTRKADGSPVTAADLAADGAIGEVLSTTGLPIVSEETAARDWSGSWVWMVDPLDGTKEFAAGRADYTVNVALLQDGRPVVGAVAQPARSLLYCGAEGLGAYSEEGGTRREMRTRKAGTELSAVASRSHGDARTAAFLTANGIEDVVSCGSSLKFCRVAEAAADVYARFGPTMAWDTAAAHAVLAAAGGCVLELDGTPLSYSASDLRNPPFVALGRQSAFAGLDFGD